MRCPILNELCPLAHPCPILCSQYGQSPPPCPAIIVPNTSFRFRTFRKGMIYCSSFFPCLANLITQIKVVVFSSALYSTALDLLHFLFFSLSSWFGFADFGSQIGKKNVWCVSERLERPKRKVSFCSLSLSLSPGLRKVQSWRTPPSHACV